MFYTVYKTTNLINKKIYIGVHKTLNPNDSYIGSGKILADAILKYGKENFVKEVLFVFSTLLEAYNKEQELVNEEFVKRSDTYNLIKGGSISPDKDPNKVRKVLRGSDHPNYGKPLPDYHKKNISKGLKGKPQTQEAILARSKSLKGRASPTKGKTLTDDDRRKKSIAALNRIKIQCEHCSIYVDPANFTQYHGNKCKLSPNFTEEMRLARSISKSKPRTLKLKTCPHCNKEGSGGNMSRYHFDNCKRFTS